MSSSARRAHAPARDNLRRSPPHERHQPSSQLVREHQLAVLLARGDVGEAQGAARPRDDGELLGPRAPRDERAPTAVPTTAWPTSRADTTTFSAAVSRLRFFSIPATVRNTASSNSFSPTSVRPLRPARRAASLTRFASSAPVNPAVICATSSASNPGARGSALAPMCTPRISRRPCLSGRSTETVRSNRPGRFRAASRVSARLVAARQMTRLSPSKPSSSVRSWLSVCSRSSLPMPRMRPRSGPSPPRRSRR